MTPPAGALRPRAPLSGDADAQMIVMMMVVMMVMGMAVVTPAMVMMVVAAAATVMVVVVIVMIVHASDVPALHVLRSAPSGLPHAQCCVMRFQLGDRIGNRSEQFGIRGRRE